MVALGISILWGWVGVSLWRLQVVEGAALAQAAQQRFLTMRNDPLTYRGRILAQGPSGGLVPLAYSEDRFRVLLIPQLVERPDTLFLFLKDRDGVTVETFTQWLQQRKPVVVADNLSASEMRQLQRRLGDEKGVRYLRTTVRTYPFGSLAAHLVGTIGYTDRTVSPRGIYGVEAFYDEVLATGKLFTGSGWFSLAVGEVAQFLPFGDTPHGDVVLTLDLPLQQQVEKVLDSLMEQWKPEEAGAIVYRPSDGAVLAMAARPSFLPTFPRRKDPPLVNPLTQKTYEFGSVMKPLTVAFGLEQSVIHASSTYLDTGSATYDGSVIHNYDARARGHVSVQEILSQSLNVGAAWVATQLNPQWFLKKLTTLFAAAPIIDLPSVRGSVANVAEGVAAGRSIEIATASFGQGFRTSAVAMARALGALANGGRTPPLHVGAFVLTQTGRRIPLQPPASTERVFSESTAATVTEMLIKVVDTVMARGKFRDPNYTTAAKTGTAQIARADGKGYRTDAYLHSFFGYFPARNPQYAVFLYLRAPRHARYASETLTKPFMAIRDYLLERDLPPPDRFDAREHSLSLGRTIPLR